MVEREVLTDLSPPALARAIETNLHAQFLSWGGWRGAEVRDEGDLLLLSTPTSIGMFNGAFRLGLAPERADSRLIATLAYFAGRGAGMFWQVGPGTTPPDVPARLRRLGARQFDDAYGMALRLEEFAVPGPAPDGLRIERVRDDRTLADYVAAMCQGFGSPASVHDAFLDLYRCLGYADDAPSLHFVGYLDGQPVASSTLQHGGVAGIYNVATVPARRGRGFGTALTVAAVCEAQRLGYRAAILHASAQGRGIYRRLGFRDYCTIQWFGSSP